MGSRAILDGVFAFVMIRGMCHHCMKSFWTIRVLLEARLGLFGVFLSFGMSCFIVNMSSGACFKLRTHIVWFLEYFGKVWQDLGLVFRG